MIKGATLLTDSLMLGGAGVAVEAGRVTAVALDPHLPDASEVVDAGGQLLMPGGVDCHAHVYDPDYTHREDWASGSAAAAAGGVTTLIDMPLVLTVMPELAREKIQVGERDSMVDFSLHAGMMETEEHLRRMPELVEMGIRSFKAFTTAPFRVGYDYIERLAARARDLGGVVTVHSEDDAVIREAEREVREVKGRRDPLAHHDSRPPEAEAAAVARLVAAARATGGRIHVAHMTTAQGVGEVAAAKSEGLRVTAETCLHYLVFTKADVERWGPYLKMTPPLRTSYHVEALWRGIASGAVDAVATDHAPGTREEKEVGWEDIWRAWGGIPGVETLVPVTLSEGVWRRGLDPRRVCRVLCRGPAEAFGLYPRKGSLAPGSDADLVLFDRKVERVVRAADLHYKVGWTPYDGILVRGWPSRVYVRGELVALEGEPVGRRGHGRFVPMGEVS